MLGMQKQVSETDFYFVLSGTVRRPATEVRMAESLTNCWKGRDKPQVQADCSTDWYSGCYDTYEKS